MPSSVSYCACLWYFPTWSSVLDTLQVGCVKHNSAMGLVPVRLGAALDLSVVFFIAVWKENICLLEPVVSGVINKCCSVLSQNCFCRYLFLTIKCSPPNSMWCDGKSQRSNNILKTRYIFKQLVTVCLWWVTGYRSLHLLSPRLSFLVPLLWRGIWPSLISQRFSHLWLHSSISELLEQGRETLGVRLNFPKSCFCQELCVGKSSTVSFSPLLLKDSWRLPSTFQRSPISHLPAFSCSHRLPFSISSETLQDAVSTCHQQPLINIVFQFRKITRVHVLWPGCICLSEASQASEDTCLYIVWVSLRNSLLASSNVLNWHAVTFFTSQNAPVTPWPKSQTL